MLRNLCFILRAMGSIGEFKEVVRFVLLEDHLSIVERVTLGSYIKGGETNKEAVATIQAKDKFRDWQKECAWFSPDDLKPQR